ncbi:hypothetical protein HHK36_020305 [Tetracentron sinense]|uniref:Disease resistance protein RPM1-like n=1 Tax=Tetracentron sinense TaxID=13715 RepID=A0A834YTT4_TETSI|nr:hypothetical protein HHK36_020305 [Tetracentron sinense]
MAESAVTFLLQRLTTLPEQELKRLTGVNQEVEFITKELQMIQGFLRDADAREESEKAVKAWVDQVREIAYDMEEILDEFTFLQQQFQWHGFVGSLYKTIYFVKHLKLRHNLATKIQAIKASVVEVSARRQRYGLNCLKQSSSSNSSRDSLHGLRQNALLLEEAELVGINEPRKKLIRWLVEGESRIEIVSVWSMGGSGKTTLVRKVYDHPRVKEYFKHHAWINVSESFKINELLKDLIKQLYDEIRQSVPQGVDTMDQVGLKMMVREFLQQKRYVVVLDDIWSIDAWEAIKYALPNSNCSSRIMITTRSSDIASSCKEPYGHVYNLEPLDDIKKSKEQNFGAIAVAQNTQLHEKVKHLSIHNSVGNVYVPQNKSFCHLRSLFMFGVDTLPKLYMRAFFSSFRMLRVLDLSDAPLESLPNEIVNLFHLRYLSLRRTKIKELPNSIGKLRNLETLDLGYKNFLCELPNEIFKLKQLRYLKFENIKASPISINESRDQVGIWSLVNLQVLRDINLSQGRGAARELGRLTQLRRLGIRGLRREDGVDLCRSIEKMSNLRFLDVQSNRKEVLDIQSLSSPPMLLQKFYLAGNLEKFPNWIPSLNNLERIILACCKLRDDPLEVLQTLSNLVWLRLYDAYDGEELCLKEGGFQRLETLEFFRLERLRLVRLEKGSLPRLQNIYMDGCKMLEKVPLGTECLSNLKVFSYREMSNEFVMSLNPNEQGGDYWKIAHIPTIFSLNIGNDGRTITTYLNQKDCVGGIGRGRFKL